MKRIEDRISIKSFIVLLCLFLLLVFEKLFPKTYEGIVGYKDNVRLDSARILSKIYKNKLETKYAPE
jgi:hypothetical protein